MPLLSTKNRILMKLFVPQRRKPDPRHAIPEEDKNLTGKTIVMTGATDGIGRVAAQMFYNMGANLILIGRKQEKGDAVITELTANGDIGEVSFELCDLSSMDSVKACAKRILTHHKRIDILVNGAGVNATRKTITKDGFELNWAVNYFAPILLTRLLIDRIVESAPARIVYVVTDLAFINKIDCDKIAKTPDFATDQPYTESKLSGSMFMIDLSQKLEGKGVAANYLHPGNIKSNLLRHMPDGQQVIRRIMHAMQSPTEVGADRIVRLAISSKLEGVSGTYFAEDKLKPPHPEARIAEKRKRIADITEEALAPWL